MFEYVFVICLLHLVQQIIVTITHGHVIFISKYKLILLLKLTMFKPNISKTE